MFPLKNLACKGGNYGLKNGGEVGPWAHVLLITTVVITIDYTTKGPLLLTEISLTEISLTLKHREKHGCVVSTVATDALVLKHQAISIHNADCIGPVSYKNITFMVNSITK